MTRPFANFHCRPDDLYRALCFGDIEEMAAELGVSAQQLAYWRCGREPVPKVVFLKQFGPFWGFRLSRHGETLECPGTGVRIPYDEIAMMTERDFYQSNCHQQARAGWLINQIFPTDED